MPFGVSSAPAIWQRVIEEVVKKIPGVVVYFNDLLLSGRNRAEHNRRMKEMLARFQKFGIRVGKDKCVFLIESVSYLGYTVTKEGISPDADKVSAIVDASPPHDVQYLQSFLGLLNFYCRFLPNLSTLLHPLHRLLQKGVKWEWTTEQSDAFSSIKQMMAAAPILTHYRHDLPLILEVDASPYGVGGCLFHDLPEGKRPVYFVSRSLTAAEKNYSQIDRGALAIVFAIKRLHQFVYGRHFLLRTDHKPLLRILGENVGLPSTVVARLQRWAVILSAYDFTMEHIKGSDNFVADGLSRVPEPLSDVDEAFLIHVTNEFCCDPCGDIPISADDVDKATADDEVLRVVMRYMRSDWPDDVTDTVKPYYRVRHDLTLERGCILWKNRVVIPLVFRRAMLQELHSIHLGVSRMKSVARSFIWWPGLDADIALLCATCDVCREHSKLPPKDIQHQWVYPSRPFERIHVDFAEHGQKFYLLAVDAYSKWLEVYELGRDSTTSKTISCLLKLISQFGIPQFIVSDNGPQFTSEEFASFCVQNGIVHKRTPPYHPASNGQVERMVQELKKSLKTRVPSVSVSTQISRFLFAYRNTPHSTTNESPASLLFKFVPTTRLSCCQPSLSRERREPAMSSRRGFEKGDHVWTLNRLPRGAKWVRGCIDKRLGPLIYLVVVNGVPRQVHVEHLRSFHSYVDHRGTADYGPPTIPQPMNIPNAVDPPRVPVEVSSVPPQPTTPTPPTYLPTEPPVSSPVSTPLTPVVKPQRARRPVRRLIEEV